MRVHREETDARRIHARNDEIRADVALVLEEVLLQHRHAGDDARLAARREGVQFEVRGDEGGGEFGVGGGAGAGTPYLGGDVVKFLAILRWCKLISFEEGVCMRGWLKTLSATMGPLVALVSAAITTPPSKTQPTMVVPVLVAFGKGTPLAWRATLRL